MVALGVAILDRQNNPLYLQDFGEIPPAPSDEELMGLETSILQETKETKCSTRLQFILHAALDRLEEMAGPPPGYGWRLKSGAAGTDGMFVGLLAPVEEMRVYAYVTTSQVRILVVVEDEAMPETQKSADEEIKKLLVNIHNLYVADLMNPFKDIGSPIVSKKFSDCVQNFVTAFNQSDGI